MKKLFILLLATSSFVACKKETSTPNSSTNTTNSSNVTITGFNCNNVQIEGEITKNQEASDVTATISYTGGNGKLYTINTVTSTGVTGLTATLQAGILANGNGNLIYTITGTPVTTGTASFAVSFGGQSCTINVTIKEGVPTVGVPGATIKDIDGNTYKTVIIGTQTWMAENLKVGKYNDGTAIPNVTDKTQWQNTTSGAWDYFYYDFYVDPTNPEKFGKLYNGYVVSSDKNVCPTGWHLPSTSEWKILTEYLGGNDLAGGKLKETGSVNWLFNVGATNSALFNARPGGMRDNEGGCHFIHESGYWWSSTIDPQEANDFYYIQITSSDTYVLNNSSYPRSIGLSIRCVKN